MGNGGIFDVISDIYLSEVSHVILLLRRLRQEDHEYKGSLSYIVRPCLKTITINNNNDDSKTFKLCAMVHTCKLSLVNQNQEDAMSLRVAWAT